LKSDMSRSSPVCGLEQATSKTTIANQTVVVRGARAAIEVSSTGSLLISR
jgi:hypothetical protein